MAWVGRSRFCDGSNSAVPVNRACESLPSYTRRIAAFDCAVAGASPPICSSSELLSPSISVYTRGKKIRAGMDADALLAAYAAAVAGRIGHTDLTVTSELRDYGRRNFTPLQFLGVFLADLEPPRTRHRSFYVQNTDPSSKGGEHWIAVGREPGRSDLVFDSFGRTPGAKNAFQLN